MALTSTPLRPPDPAYNSYRATPAVEFVERCLRDWWCDALPGQLDHPLIAVSSRDDRAVVGVVFERCAEYCNNLEADMACIHSDPLFGAVEQGSAATARGKAIYFDGGSADFIQKASTIYA